MKNIVVGYDDFARNEKIPALAISFAEEHGAGLHVVHVVAPPPRKLWAPKDVAFDEVLTALVEHRRSQIQDMIGSIAKRGIDVRAVVRVGSPHVEIIRAAASIHADLVMVSDEPTGRDTRGFRTVTRKLLRECPYPVLAKRDPRKYRHRHILAAIDIEPASSNGPGVNKQIVNMAATIARRANSKLTIFHAWELWGEELLRGQGRVKPDRMQEVLDDTKRYHQEHIQQVLRDCDLDGVDAEVELAKGEPRALLNDVTAKRKVDLVVMGTVCRTGPQAVLMGNTAERVLNELLCSVLVVKPEKFISPVPLTDD